MSEKSPMENADEMASHHSVDRDGAVAQHYQDSTILAIAERLIGEGELEDDDLEDEDESFGNCLDISCVYTCSPKICETKKFFKSNLLRRARDHSVKILAFDGIIFPLLPNLMRDIVVGGELLYTIAGLILSVISYVKADCHRTFNLVSFVLGSVAMLLSIASTFEAFFNRCRKHFCNNDDEKGTSIFAELINVLRNVFAELLIYPVLICSIFSLVTGRPFSSGAPEDIVMLIRFGLSAISFIAFVYILRLIILVGAILKIKASCKTLYFLVYFSIHVALQMIVQIFMIVVTGREIYEENLHFYNTSIQNFTDFETSCLPVKISGYLWYMIIGSYLFPIMGVMMFFAVGFYWMQEFFIGIFSLIPGLLKSSGLSDAHKTVKKAIEMINKNFPQEKFNDEFCEFSEVCVCEKLIYPFKSPLLVITCILFLISNYLFISVGNYGTAIDFLGPISFFHSFHGSVGWSLVYLIGAIVGILANLYAFLVGIVWLILIEIIIMIILSQCLILILCYCICGNKKDGE